MSIDDKIKSAHAEAEVIAKLLGLVRGRASGHGDVDIKVERVTASTVVYRRGDKVFHIVVHDMTEFTRDVLEQQQCGAPRCELPLHHKGAHQMTIKVRR